MKTESFEESVAFKHSKEVREAMRILKAEYRDRKKQKGKLPIEKRLEILESQMGHVLTKLASCNETGEQ